MTVFPTPTPSAFLEGPLVNAYLLQVIVFPISIVIGNILKGYPTNGFADVEHACYNNTSPSFTQPSVVCARPVAAVCAEPNRFLFWVRPHSDCMPC